MSSGKFTIYITICLLALGILGYQIIQRQQRQGEVVINLSSTPVKSDAFISSELVKNALDLEEFNTWYLEEKLRSEPVISGRDDPFARLPLEKYFPEAPAGNGTPDTFENDALLSVTEHPVVIRGIMIGREPVAYVEEENGFLRKVTVGDPIGNGIVVSITTNTVVIRYNENLVTKKLGE